MPETKPWPFDAWLKIAVIQFGLSSQDFWKMSLQDWFALTHPNKPNSMTRQDLIQLEKTYATRK